ncbi:MAG: glycosyltransferase family 2 protein [Spirochaetota bacterium]
MKDRIVIISPVRNEADLLPGTIRSMLQQTIKPREWILVNDGSTDATESIIREAMQENPWIRLINKPDRGERSVGPGVVETFYYGYERIETKDYDYICKMDGDVEFEPEYFKALLQEFEEDSYLGAASGKPYLEVKGELVIERTNDNMVAGMINFYRCKCFADIGGFVREVHWDGIAFHQARIKGWRTRSFNYPKLRFIHKRLMGSSHKGVMHGRQRWGKGQYFMGTHPLYLLTICLYRMLERPFIIGGLGILLGYAKAWKSGMKQYSEPGFRESLRAWQLERLHLGKRLEQIPEVKKP